MQGVVVPQAVAVAEAAAAPAAVVPVGGGDEMGAAMQALTAQVNLTPEILTMTLEDVLHHFMHLACISCVGNFE